MFRPIACVSSLKTSPCVDPISVKYSSGSTLTSAPVGQFSSHEYLCRLAPFGLSGVASQRLHLMATTSSDAGGAIGSAGFTLNARVNFWTKLKLGGSDFLGTMEIASYGHCVAQSKHPMQVCGSMSTCPRGSRNIE